MKLIKAELYKWKRVKLGGIKKITINFVNDVLIILGTNGSGKSSLLRELTPLPAEESDYLKGGYKEIVVSHNQETYTLRSSFEGNKSHHTFELNGVNLNDGKTITVQRELVKQIFGYTKRIDELVFGDKKFTKMTPSARREWFSELCPTSYEYALKVHDQIKENINYTTSALKFAKNKLANEAANILDDKVIEELKKDIELIDQEVQLLYSQKNNQTYDNRQIADKEGKLLSAISQLSMKILRVKTVSPYGTTLFGEDVEERKERNEWGELIYPKAKSIDDINVVIDRLKHRRTEILSQSNQISEIAMEVVNKIELINRAGNKDLNELVSRKEKLLVEQRDLRTRFRNSFTYKTKMSQAKQMLEPALFGLNELLISMPSNEDRSINSNTIKELKDGLGLEKNRLKSIESDLVRLESNLEHVLKHSESKDVDCPRCQHKFNPFLINKNPDSIKKQIANCGSLLDKQVKLVEELTTKYDEMMDYAGKIMLYRKSIATIPSLEEVWLFIENEELIFKRPREVVDILLSVFEDLKLGELIEGIEESISKVDEMISIGKMVDGQKLDELIKQRDGHEKRLGEFNRQLSSINSQIDEFTTYRDRLNEMYKIESQISEYCISLDKLTADKIESLHQQYLNSTIASLQESLTKKREVFQKALIQTELIKEYEIQIRDLDKQREMSKALLRAMSPSEGLIADGLIGFVRKFVLQVNKLIEKIWTYPLQIQSCGVTDDVNTELDYLFPMMVQSKDNIIEDVRLGSEGMQEIVNLAFVVVALRYLGLQDFPLYLDEWGKGFDMQHRLSASNLLKLLLETTEIPQLFIISHYLDVYGTYTNRDYCVLDSRNLVVNDITNQNIIIEVE